MNYDGPFPYLETTDQLHDVPAWSRELAELLELRDPWGGSGPSSQVLPAASSMTLVPSMSTSALTLGSPTLCAITFNGLLNSTSSAYTHLQLLITCGDGTLLRLTSLYDRVLFKVATDAPYSRTWHVRIPGGSTAVKAQMEYTAPSSATVSLTYASLNLAPIRPVA